MVCPARDFCAGAGTVFIAVAATIGSLCKHQNDLPETCSGSAIALKGQKWGHECALWENLGEQFCVEINLKGGMILMGKLCCTLRDATDLIPICPIK